MFSAVVFFGTVAVSALVVGDQARYYFTDLLGDAERVGPIGTSFNQSWRGGISRIPRPRRRIRAAGAGGDRRHRRAQRSRRGAWAPATGWAASSSCNCSGCCCPRSRGPITGPGLIPPMIWLLHGLLRQRLGRGSSAGVAGLDVGRCAVAAELCPADHLADRPAVVSGLGRTDLHRGDAGDARVGRR